MDENQETVSAGFRYALEARLHDLLVGDHKGEDIRVPPGGEIHIRHSKWTGGHVTYFFDEVNPTAVQFEAPEGEGLNVYPPEGIRRELVAASINMQNGGFLQASWNDDSGVEGIVIDPQGDMSIFMAHSSLPDGIYALRHHTVKPDSAVCTGFDPIVIDYRIGYDFRGSVTIVESEIFFGNPRPMVNVDLRDPLTEMHEGPGGNNFTQDIIVTDTIKAEGSVTVLPELAVFNTRLLEFPSGRECDVEWRAGRFDYLDVIGSFPFYPFSG